MAKLSTHILDLASGQPAAGVTIALTRDGVELKTTTTNAEGRTDAPLLEGDDMKTGTYTLHFAVGDYFARRGNADAKRFLDVVPIVFVIDDASKNYHVPLLVSPWAYSTYRGS